MLFFLAAAANCWLQGGSRIYCGRRTSMNSSAVTVCGAAARVTTMLGVLLWCWGPATCAGQEQPSITAEGLLDVTKIKQLLTRCWLGTGRERAPCPPLQSCCCIFAVFVVRGCCW